MLFGKARHLPGFFYVQDYVQDERYIAIEHMDVRCDCVRLAQSFSTCLAAKVVQCLISGHAVNPSMGARTRLPVSYGPETRHYTPSASWVILVLWILTDRHTAQLDSVYAETATINLLSGVISRQSINHFIAITCAHLVHH